MKTVYIYGLYDPRTDIIKYVGRTYNPTKRLSNHLRDAVDANVRKARWISELKSIGLKPIIKIIEQCDDSNWGEREKFWIEDFRKKNIDIFNISCGGDKFAYQARGTLLRTLLTGDDVKAIRNLYQDGVAVNEIAGKFPVKYSEIQRIVHNQHWYDPNYIPKKRRTFHKVTEQDAIEIRKLHNEGSSRDDLMIKFDSSANVIQEIITNKRFYDPNYIRRDGNWRTAFRFNSEESEKIKKLRKDGYTLKQLCELFDADWRTIKYFADGIRKYKKMRKNTRSHVISGDQHA